MQDEGSAIYKGIPRVLPRGRHQLSRDVVRASQRERLLEAMTEVTAEKGYASVTIADIVTRAGTARRAFYEHFTDKLDCFLASFSRVVDHVLETIANRFNPSLDQYARVEGAARGFLEFLASNPTLAWTYFVDINTVGPEGVAMRLAVHRRIARMIVALRAEVTSVKPGVSQLTDHQALAVVGALHEMSEQALHERGADKLVELTDTLVPLIVALLELPARAASGQDRVGPSPQTGE